MREVTRQLFQDHLTLRAGNEARRQEVVDAEGCERTRIERGRHRTLATMARIAYRGTRVAHPHPADAVLNLPEGMHSHGPARLAAIESARSSFADAYERINAGTGTGAGHRQVQKLAAGAAADIDVFYDALAPAPRTDATPLIVSVDGKGVVIKPETLREDTAKAAAAKGGNAMRTTRAARRTFYRPSAKRRESAAQPKVGHGENSHTAKTLCARPLEQLAPVRCPDQQ